MRKHINNMLSLLIKHKTKPEAIRQVHAQMILTGLHAHALPITVWNSLLRPYSLSSYPEDAILLFKNLQMRNPPVTFDSFVYSFLIKAYANLQAAILGSQIHGLTIRAGFEFHLYVQTALVNMYAVCGFLVEAKKEFDEMPERNSVTWNALITGLTKWGELGMALSLFNQMPAKNVVSWTGIIDGYTRINKHKEALSLFRRMVVSNGIRPTEVTILAILPAIWNSGCLKSCQTIHTFAGKSGFIESDIRVANSFIDAYTKCGCIDSAIGIFKGLSYKKRNLVSWTSMISGFAMHGMVKQAANGLEQMELEGWKPNRVTFLSILNAYSHGGLVEEGLQFFRMMVEKCQVVPDIKHYGCLIDMLGRAGRFEEAEKVALQVPAVITNAVIWRTLLGASSFHGNVEVGERVTRKILEIERGYAGDYVLLSNIYTGAGRFSDAEGVRSLMDERNTSKMPGLSMV